MAMQQREYRRFAVGHLDLAKQIQDSDERIRDLILAEAWLDLAQQTAQPEPDEVRDRIERPLVAAHVIRVRSAD